jgi:hypothetical protein
MIVFFIVTAMRTSNTACSISKYKGKSGSGFTRHVFWRNLLTLVYGKYSVMYGV